MGAGNLLRTDVRELFKRAARWTFTWRNARRVEIVVVALLGAWLGTLVFGSVNTDIGPVHTRLALRPSLSGGSEVHIPPLGSLRLKTNAGPLRLDATVTEIDSQAAARIVQDPESLAGLESRVEHDLRGALVWLVVKSVIAALVGAAVLTFLVLHRRRAVVVGVLVTVVALAASTLSVATTWNKNALAEPKYTGLLTRAPEIVGDVQDIVSRFSSYSAELAKLVTNVSRLYTVTSTLPTIGTGENMIRVLHVSDIHLNPEAWDVIRAIDHQFDVDVIVDTGDLTDHGSAAENVFVDQIRTLGRPYIFIKGNHDSAATVAAVAAQSNATVLDHTTTEVDGLRIYGAPDPRFTPDKQTHANENDKAMVAYGMGVAADVDASQPPRIDLVMMHDPIAAEPLDGYVPLVLAGHIHKREVKQLPHGTLMLVAGSTGGAGLRALDHSKPTPVECSVLYFDPITHDLVGYDDITLGGLGLASATIERHVINKEPDLNKPEPSAPPSVGPSPFATPTPSPTLSPSGSPLPGALPSPAPGVPPAAAPQGPPGSPGTPAPGRR